MAVQLATVARKDDAGSRSLRAVLKSGATPANGATRVLGTSYALYDDRFEVDPATGAARTKAASTRSRPGWRWWRDGRSGSARPRVRYCCRAVPAALPTQQAAEFLLRAIAWARGGQQAMEVLRSVADGDGTASNRPPILLVSVCECASRPDRRSASSRRFARPRSRDHFMHTGRERMAQPWPGALVRKSKSHPCGACRTERRNSAR